MDWHRLVHVPRMRINAWLHRKICYTVFVMSDIEKRKEVKREWESIHPIDRPDWESFKRGIWKGRKLSHIWPMADMADRERRAKEWTEHLAKKSEINAWLYRKICYTVFCYESYRQIRQIERLDWNQDWSTQRLGRKDCWQNERVFYQFTFLSYEKKIHCIWWWWRNPWKW